MVPGDIIPALTVLWIFIFFVVSFFLPYKSEAIDYGMLVENVVRLLNAVLILPPVTYQIYIFCFVGDIDFEFQLMVQKVQLSYYIADAFWIFVWVKNLDKNFIAHHILAIFMTACSVYYKSCLVESAFEYFAIEQSAALSKLKGILKSYRQDNTKIMIITEISYFFDFFLTKIFMRLVLMYYYVFRWNSSLILVYINYFLQILYFLWGYNLISVNYSKWLKGYFTYENLTNCPWIRKLQKDNKIS